MDCFFPANRRKPSARLELAKWRVVGDRGLPQLHTSDANGLELDCVAFAVERARPLPASFAPPQFPLAVRLAL